jgi:hypothetical protein
MAKKFTGETGGGKKGGGGKGGFEQGLGRITDKITKFSGDAGFWRANIVNSFLEFGYYPTEAEVAQLIPTSAGEGGFERGQSSVAQYVQARQDEIEQKENDPLKGFIEEEKVRRGEFEKQASDLYGQLQNVIKSSPQLFGSLSEDQIGTLLAPLQRAFQESGSQLEGALGRRNLTGSSIEANALAENERLYKQNVLATGLDLGLKQKDLEATAIRDRIGQLVNSASLGSQLMGQGFGQISSQELGTMQYLQQLPYFLRQSALQEQAFHKAMEGPSLWDNIDRGIGTATNIFNLGKSVASTVSGGMGGAPSSQPLLNAGAV